MSPQGKALECLEVSQRLEAFVDQELGAAEQQAITRHLEHCQACAAEHRLALEVRNGLRQLPRFDLSHRTIQELHERISLRQHARQWRLAAAAASVALVASLGILWHQYYRVPDAEVAAATQQARFALAQVHRFSRFTGLTTQHVLASTTVGDDTIRRTTHLLAYSLETVARAQPAPEDSMQRGGS